MKLRRWLLVVLLVAGFSGLQVGCDPEDHEHVTVTLVNTCQNTTANITYITFTGVKQRQIAPQSTLTLNFDKPAYVTISVGSSNGKVTTKSFSVNNQDATFTIRCVPGG